MTNFALVNAAPVISSLASKEKGSLGNRVDCAMAHNANELKTAAMTAGVLGTTTVLAKNPKVASALEIGLVKGANVVLNMGKKVGNKFAKTKAGSVIVNNFKKLGNTPVLKKIAKFVYEGANSFNTVARKNPILAGIGLTALIAIGLNKYYKSGQIDQKYTDKAQMQNVVR